LLSILWLFGACDLETARPEVESWSYIMKGHGAPLGWMVSKMCSGEGQENDKIYMSHLAHKKLGKSSDLPIRARRFVYTKYFLN
jgi:hypothetical protein